MPHIRHEIIIGAPAEKIYHAITSQEGLSAWWTPGTTIHPAPENTARFAFGPDYFKEMKILTQQPFEQVQWICTKGAGEWIGTTITFRLHTGGKAVLLSTHPEAQDQVQQQQGDTATLLMFQQDDWKAYTPMFAECNYTWGQFLKSLKLFCETGKGRPWPHQHQ